MHRLAQLRHKLLSLGSTEIAITAKLLTQGVELPQLHRWQTLWRILQRTLHESAEGVGAALEIAKASVSFQLRCSLQEVAPGPQAGGGGFSWLS